jgi:hypothetical protein
MARIRRLDIDTGKIIAARPQLYTMSPRLNKAFAACNQHLMAVYVET